MATRFTTDGSLHPGELFEARLNDWRTPWFSKVCGRQFGLGPRTTPYPATDAETSAMRERSPVAEAEIKHLQYEMLSEGIDMAGI
jgi:hypothetical protein